MSFIKDLKFVEIPRGSKSSPEQHRRNKLITRLEQQLKLSQDPSYTPIKLKWLRDANGIRQLVEVRKRISPWWRTDAAGRVMLAVKYGSRPIEFEKGKAAIMIGGKDQVTATIERLIKAVADGEFDVLLADAKRGPRDVPRKKAA